MTTNQALHFRDPGRVWNSAVDTAPDPTFHTSDSPGVTLGQWLSRPQVYKTVAWKTYGRTAQQNRRLNFNFNPWDEFLNSRHVREKVRYWRFIRCTLKVKFVLNTTPFMYGTAIAAYTPLSGEDSFPAADTTDTKDPNIAVLLSQRPHIYLSADSSSDGVITCPFVYTGNYLDLTTASDAEIAGMGRIDVQEINPLLVTTGQGWTTTQIESMKATVTVFMWAEDVQLTMPTTHGPPYGSHVLPRPASQAADEYGEGPVSKIANAVAMGSGQLTTTPVIGPYARATSMVAAGIASIASAFGYSRPAVLDNVKPFKPTYWSNLANTDAGDTTFKLTVGSKQEVTIDPRVTGLNDTDEMTIQSIASRESFFFTGVWLAKQEADERFAAWNVCPGLFNCSTKDLVRTDMTKLWPEITSSMEHSEAPTYLTSTCFAALPFKYWRGTMRFRIQIVAPALVRGRCRLVWDPVYPQESFRSARSVQVAYLEKMDLPFSVIIDLAETRDLTVDIGWGQIRPYATNDASPGDTHFWPPNNTKMALPWYSTPDTDYSSFSNNPNQFYKNTADTNGVIGMYVLNPLVFMQNPNPDQDVDNSQRVFINVFASCPDLEVACPAATRLNNYEVRDSAHFPASRMRRHGSAEYHKELLGIKDVKLEEDNVSLASEPSLDGNVADSQADAGPGVMMPEALGPNMVEGSSGEVMRLGPAPVRNSDRINEIFFGDPIVSIRALLKRYCNHCVLFPHEDESDNASAWNNDVAWGSWVINTWVLSDFPGFKGDVAFGGGTGNIKVCASVKNSTGAQELEDDVPWMLAKLTYLNYFSIAYVARRGGIRWKYAVGQRTVNTDLTTDDPPLITIEVERGADKSVDTQLTRTVWKKCMRGVTPTQTDKLDLKSASWSAIYLENSSDGNAGMAVSPLLNNPVVEVELPYYNPLRFTPARNIALNTEFAQRHRVRYTAQKRTTPTELSAGVVTHCAAADDFSLHLFIGCPPLRRKKAPLVFTPEFNYSLIDATVNTVTYNKIPNGGVFVQPNSEFNSG